MPARLDTWAQELFEEYGGFGKGFRPRVVDLGVHRPPDPLFPFNAAGHVGSGNNVAFRREALFRFVELPVTHLPRTAGRPTGGNPRVIARAFRDLIWLRLRLDPCPDEK